MSTSHPALEPIQLFEEFELESQEEEDADDERKLDQLGIRTDKQLERFFQNIGQKTRTKGQEEAHESVRFRRVI